MSSIAQQASAVEVAVRIISGAAPKPSSRERDYILNNLKAAAVTLRNAEYEQGRRS